MLFGKCCSWIDTLFINNVHNIGLKVEMDQGHIY